MSKPKIYNDKSKQNKGRNPIWKLLNPEPADNVLIMPEMNLKEYKIVRNRYDIPAEQIFVVDKSTGKLAYFTRQLKTIEQDKTHRMATLVSSACKKWASNGIRIQVMHLDFCCTAKKAAIELELVAKSGIIEDGRIAVTFYGAHDPGFSSNLTRISIIREAIQNSFQGQVKQIADGRYHNKSGRSPMLWVVFEIMKSEREGSMNKIDGYILLTLEKLLGGYLFGQQPTSNLPIPDKNQNQNQNQKRLCPTCSIPFTPNKHNQQYCSEKCRGVSYRKKNFNRSSWPSLVVQAIGYQPLTRSELITGLSSLKNPSSAVSYVMSNNYISKKHGLYQITKRELIY